MPLYSFSCPACGHKEEVLMKSTDPKPDCPKCGSKEFSKDVSAPLFKLKGSGWYATDFKGKK